MVYCMFTRAQYLLLPQADCRQVTFVYKRKHPDFIGSISDDRHIIIYVEDQTPKLVRSTHGSAWFINRIFNHLFGYLVFGQVLRFVIHLNAELTSLCQLIVYTMIFHFYLNSFILEEYHVYSQLSSDTPPLLINTQKPRKLHFRGLCTLVVLR